MIMFMQFQAERGHRASILYDTNLAQELMLIKQGQDVCRQANCQGVTAIFAVY